VADYVNLFDFAMADITGDGNAEIIAVTQNDLLIVLQDNGRVLWQSDDPFGGTSRFIGDDPNEGGEFFANKTSEPETRIYVPSPIIVGDFNKDGISEILVNRNSGTSGVKYFRNMKKYGSGEITALGWNGIALSELWKTNRIDGEIIDYSLQTTADSGKAALYVGLILKSGGWFSAMNKGESTVLFYDLELE